MQHVWETGQVCKEYWWGDGQKPLGRPTLGRPRRRCEDIKINLQEVGWGGLNWIDLAQVWDR